MRKKLKKESKVPNHKKDKISILMVANDMKMNGISSVIMNYTRNLNPELFEVCIAIGEPIEDVHLKELKNMGKKIWVLPNRKKNPIKFYIGLMKIFKAKIFDIIHVHGNSSTMAIELSIAKICGVKHRIAHSHNSTCGNMLRHNILKPWFDKVYTYKLACSTLAGDWIFGKSKFDVINNGFMVEKYRFESNKRTYYREKLNLNEKYVIGHVGRFNDQKNHPFLIKVFEKIAEKNKQAYLLLVGNGPNYNSIVDMISKSKYSNRIIVYGNSDDIAGLMSAMDIFLLPSKYEGLGIVLLEAQICGLPCITSEKVPKDTILGNNIKFLPIKSNDISIWSENVQMQIINDKEREDFYYEYFSNIEKFDITKCVYKLEKIYFNLCS